MISRTRAATGVGIEDPLAGRPAIVVIGAEEYSGRPAALQVIYRSAIQRAAQGNATALRQVLWRGMRRRRVTLRT